MTRNSKKMWFLRYQKYPAPFHCCRSHRGPESPKDLSSYSLRARRGAAMPALATWTWPTWRMAGLGCSAGQTWALYGGFHRGIPNSWMVYGWKIPKKNGWRLAISEKFRKIDKFFFGSLKTGVATTLEVTKLVSMWKFRHAQSTPYLFEESSSSVLSYLIITFIPTLVWGSNFSNSSNLESRHKTDEYGWQLLVQLQGNSPMTCQWRQFFLRSWG